MKTFEEYSCGYYPQVDYLNKEHILNTAKRLYEGLKTPFAIREFCFGLPAVSRMQNVYLPNITLGHDPFSWHCAYEQACAYATYREENSLLGKSQQPKTYEEEHDFYLSRLDVLSKQAEQQLPSRFLHRSVRLSENIAHQSAIPSRLDDNIIRQVILGCIRQRAS